MPSSLINLIHSSSSSSTKGSYSYPRLFQSSFLSSFFARLKLFFMSSKSSSSSSDSETASGWYTENVSVTSVESVPDTRSHACVARKKSHSVFPDVTTVYKTSPSRPVPENPTSRTKYEDSNTGRGPKATPKPNPLPRAIMTPPPSVTPRSSLDRPVAAQTDIRRKLFNGDTDPEEQSEPTPANEAESAMKALIPPPWHYKSRRANIRAQVAPEHPTPVFTPDNPMGFPF
ncbi:hypothetical protein D9758_010461 [Tetrapyrgos nigripes]|uniref:Uncharacterized protein n=1 Tax=Tetrapyrgos nigripes TaxID=182062 RepID=A0A8H5CQ48_9AGAR|nr:hypothetical protein D9758_010461 [Tetrapyrgos nigripes]